MKRRTKALAGFGVLAGLLAIIGVGMGSPASTAPPTGILGTGRPPVTTPDMANKVQMGVIHNGKCKIIMVPRLPAQPGEEKGRTDWDAAMRMLGPTDPKLHKTPSTPAEEAAYAAEVEKCKARGPLGVPMHPGT